jgi:hypothetical protein
MSASPTTAHPTDISAPLLNLLAPGLGQLYQHRIREGVAWSILEARHAERIARV